MFVRVITGYILVLRHFLLPLVKILRILPCIRAFIRMNHKLFTAVKGRLMNERNLRRDYNIPQIHTISEGFYTDAMYIGGNRNALKSHTIIKNIIPHL